MVSLSVAEALCEATALETEALETTGSWLERDSLSPIKPSVFVCLQVQRALHTDLQYPYPHLQLALKFKASWKKHVCWEGVTQTLHLGPNCASSEPSFTASAWNSELCEIPMIYCDGQLAWQKRRDPSRPRASCKASRWLKKESHTNATIPGQKNQMYSDDMQYTQTQTESIL